MTLQELSEIERKLFNSSVSVKGTMDEKENLISEMGIFEEYKKIHSEYSKLSEENIEALKRALFIQWYSLVEPACFTGIRQLDSAAEYRIINSLNIFLEKNSDKELLWMVGYYQKWDYVFEGFKMNKKFYDQKNIGIPIFEKEEMNDRGQMGIYWSSFH